MKPLDLPRVSPARGPLVGLGKPGQAYHDGEVGHASPDELPMTDIRQR